MITGQALDNFTGFAIRSWPAGGRFVGDDPKIGELVELIPDGPNAARAAATAAWNLRSISHDRAFGVIRIVNGTRRLIRQRDCGPVGQTYCDLQNERKRRREYQGPTTGAAA